MDEEELEERRVVVLELQNDRRLEDQYVRTIQENEARSLDPWRMLLLFWGREGSISRCLVRMK